MPWEATLLLLRVAVPAVVFLAFASGGLGLAMLFHETSWLGIGGMSGMCLLGMRVSNPMLDAAIEKSAGERLARTEKESTGSGGDTSQDSSVAATSLLSSGK